MKTKILLVRDYGEDRGEVSISEFSELILQARREVEEIFMYSFTANISTNKPSEQ